jgi:hypothetical protein
LSYALTTSAMAVVSSVLPLAATAALLTWTVSYGRRARAAALKATATAAAAAAEVAAVSREVGQPS